MMTMTKEARAMAPLDTYKPRATRYEPSRSEACLTWREPATDRAAERTDPEPSNDTKTSTDPEAERHFALLLDISQSGASVALDRVPRPTDGVWLRLEGESLTDWTEAEVVGVITTVQGPHLVRLAFRDPCPVETLVAAICG